jgi:hypothetical protein
MRMIMSILGMVAGAKLTMKTIVLAVVLLTSSLSGCSSVISNSESYYRDIPRRPINWREYLTD